MSMMTKHFVTFYSPGTFVAQSTTKEIGGWDTREAARIAGTITERYGAVPYGFDFTTRERTAEEFEPKVTKRSGVHYINGELLSLANVEPNSILAQNMRCNSWPYVVKTKGGWCQPFRDADRIVNSDGDDVTEATKSALPAIVPIEDETNSVDPVY